jgi:peptidoglycan-associated lipoprotein
MLITALSMLMLMGCHHNATTVTKTPPAPTQQSAPSAPVAAAPAKQMPAALPKAPEPTDEQLFAQNIKDIFFNYDNADIRSEEQAILSRNLEFLVKHSAMKIVIEGHCDERGSDEYNLSLGEGRASQVKTALIRGGLSPDRVKVISYGKERPFCAAADEGCWQQNRRAHFVLESQNHAAN